MAQEWKPPTYATPVESVWEPPDYAVPDEEIKQSTDPVTGQTTFDVSLKSSDQSSIMKQGWDAATKPIVDIRSATPEVKAATDQFAVDHPIVGGGLNFAADVVSGLSSPLNLATAGAFTGSALARPAIARGLTMLGKGLSAPVAAEGAYNIYNEPNLTGKSVGALELAGGIVGMKAKVPARASVNTPAKVPSATSVTPDKITTPKIEIPGAAKPRVRMTAEGSLIPQHSNPTVQKIINTIDEGLAKAKEQAAIYTSERAPRIAKIKKVTTPGEAGFYEKLGHLRGEYSKVDALPPLRESLTRNEIDEIMNLIENSQVDDAFSKLRAQSGFVKILNGEIAPIKSELDLLNAILETEIKLPGDPKLLAGPSKLRQLWEFTRGLKGVDMPFLTSAAYRQGINLVGTRQWFKAFNNSVKSFGSEQSYNTIMDALQEMPIHQKRTIINDKGRITHSSVADDIGLAQSDLKTLTSREEQIRAQLAERIPLGIGKYVRASNRSFTSFLNTLRSHTAQDWIMAADAMTPEGRITDFAVAKQLANTVNELSGHGSLKIDMPFNRFRKSKTELNLEKHAEVISTVLWSPRLMARDVRMMNPLNYAKNDKVDRVKYLQGAIRRAGVWAGFTILAALNGATVNDDPTNSDFGKARLGNTRLDAGSGLLQWIVLMSRQALGYSTSSASNQSTELGSSPIARTRQDITEEFLKNRAHPSISPILALTSAAKGKPFYMGSQAADAVLPLFAADLYELMESDPEAEQIIMGLVGSSLSMGSQTYGAKDFGKPTFDIPGDVKFEGGSLFK